MAKLIKFTVTSLHPCVILPPIRVLRDMNCIFKKVLGWQPINPSVTATVRTLLFFNLSEKVVCSWRSTRCQTARLLRTKTFVLPSLGTHAALVAAHSNKNPVSSPLPIWTNETSAHVRLTERCTNGFLYVHFRHFKSPLTLFALKSEFFTILFQEQTEDASHWHLRSLSPFLYLFTRFSQEVTGLIPIFSFISSRWSRSTTKDFKPCRVRLGRFYGNILSLFHTPAFSWFHLILFTHWFAPLCPAQILTQIS